MSKKRIEREIKAAMEMGVMLACVDEDRTPPCTIRAGISSDALGFLNFQVSFPREYPFKPFKLEILEDDTTKMTLLYSRLRLVCPDICCWARNSLKFEMSTLLDEWHHAYCFYDVIRHVSFRLCSLSLPDSVSIICDMVPNRPAASTGIVSVHFGSCGEIVGIPSDNNSECQLVILLDPHLFTGLKCSQLPDGGPAYWTCRQNSYIALSAPYCFNESLHVQALLNILDVCREKGWERVCFTLHGIFLTLPSADEVPGLLASLPFEQSQNPTIREDYIAALPHFINRSSPGITPGNYGG